MTATVAPAFRFAHFELQPGERQLLARGLPVRLRPNAFDVLVVLVENSGRLVTKGELLDRVWGNLIVEENTLQVNVSTLRKVLGAGAIATVSGQGYRFTLAATPMRKQSAHNLPQQLTSFIGRETELAQVRQWLTCTRLLTLTGAGGCGKTRLALQVTGSLLAEYPDGVWLVELAALPDATLLAQAVAHALGIEEQPGNDLAETVTTWLGARRLLLVLDNAEHLLAACAQLAHLLLRRCAGLSLLVTSRERLGIEGELIYRVPSLTVPEERSGITCEQALACEAARLFMDRARLQRPDYFLTPRDAAPLASICRRLDGIALAIELAAPRVRAMSIDELARRLDDRFDVLTGGSRAALPRHRTLRSLIDWSHDLLDDAEKALLRRASVFAGGWTLEAAEQVCPGEDVDRADVLNLLTGLADKNLVVAEPREDETRFTLLETVRHYAQDRLRESDEEESVRARHARYLRIVAEELDEATSDEETRRLLAKLAQEHDNLRAALTWCETAHGQSLNGLELAGRLHWFWIVRGHWSEGRNCLARLLAVATDGPRGEAHAKALHTAGELASDQGDDAAAEAFHRDALAIWRRLGNRRRIARSIGSLGNIAVLHNEYAAARALFEEALGIARELDDRRSVAIGLHCLGSVTLDIGDLAAARVFLEEAVAIAREDGGERSALGDLAAVHHLQGGNAVARALLLDVLARHRAAEDREQTAAALHWLARVSLEEGDLGAAKAQLRESLGAFHSLGSRAVVALLEALADPSLAAASPLDAARILGAAQHLREQASCLLAPVYRAAHERMVCAARRALHDDAAFDQAWNEGRSWTRDEAVRYALNL